ncbi:antibiotic biosynthesis monooxygenase family protein [Leisingera sp. JC1]|uniref:antibiotic biosynthesis monooxygenase family protein n=1 Tax=Leisingera sp. JC1 TaxID=1855282 RepID=UPI0008038256|nr:antibiotic biosynthesis monooxygenase [Leisingera sp. JC1]OBY28658.1 antibiotic biosynthesis monooxygenase [Leisingera sp. JC1]
MIAVIFEVEIAAGQKDAYLEIAADLRSLLEEIEGFISVERFQSLSVPDKLLSLSFWEDEAAVQRWRHLTEHRAAQRKGRAGIFADYRLRVAGVIRDYGMSVREEAPADSIAAHGRTLCEPGA